MSDHRFSHIFWSSASPMASLVGGGLLIMASCRLSHAIIVAAALLWVYCCSALSAWSATRIFPARGRYFILIFMASFFSGIYLFFLWLLNPIATMETFFLIPLIPLFYAASGIFRRIESLSLADTFARTASEALVLGILIIIFAIIREPLGFGCLSLPGGSQGMTRIISFGGESFFPIRIVASSAGALLLLGYGMALYRYFKNTRTSQEDDK